MRLGYWPFSIVESEAEASSPISPWECTGDCHWRPADTEVHSQSPPPEDWRLEGVGGGARLGGDNIHSG